MYINLRKEMSRRNVSELQLAKELCLPLSRINAKLNGQIPLSVEEAIKIRETFFPEETYQYLFKCKRGGEFYV